MNATRAYLDQQAADDLAAAERVAMLRERVGSFHAEWNAREWAELQHRVKRDVRLQADDEKIRVCLGCGDWVWDAPFHWRHAGKVAS